MSAPFRERTVLILVGAGALSLLLALGFGILGDDLTPPPHPGAHGYSRAAVGHRALLELLRRLEVPVVASQHDTLGRARSSAVLVIAEPRLERDADEARLRDMVQNAENVLLVLPKWEGTPDPARPAWMSEATLVPLDEVNRILAVLDADLQVARGVTPTLRAGDYPLPTLSAPAQFVRGELAEAAVSGEGEILLGAVSTDFGKLWILSDPDVLSNHGLDDGQNAYFTVTMLDRLRDGEGTIIFDETLHGFEREPSLWRALLEPPLLLATIQVLLAVAVLLWAATGRFGPPVPYTGGLGAGKRPLVDNIAALLEVGGHAREVLRGYLTHNVRDVARRLHAPRELDPGSTIRWLDALAESRGLPPRLADLERDVAKQVPRGQEPRHALRVARNLHRWRREMLG